MKQDPSEPFTTFIDHLTQVIDQQVMDEKVKPHMLQGRAFANANAECRRTESALPGYPTMEEMIEACSKIGTPHVASVSTEEFERMLEEQLEGFMKIVKSMESGFQ